MPVAPESGIGKRLAAARARQGLSIEEIAWRLRIRPELLRALEDEQFSELGHHGFVRTHLRSYAKALGVDVAEIVRAYRRRHEPSEPSPLEALDAKHRVARKQRPRSRWLLAGVVAASLLFAAGVVGFLRGPGARPLASAGTLPAGPRVLFEQASRGLSPVGAAAPVTARIAAVAATTVKVVVDGKRTFEGTLAPGASGLYTAKRIIEVVVADVRAVRIWANGEAVSGLVTGRWRGTIVRSGLIGAIPRAKP